MAQSLQTLLDAPVIELDSIDSTNNYAMRLIDADTAQAGTTIVAALQTQGKGQRGKQWKDARGESLLMSLICIPDGSVNDQFVFSAAIAVAVAETLDEIHEGWHVRIKWPNDIIINDKKAGGILIENVLRGNSWSFAIAGLGLNIRQNIFPDELPCATSLKIASGKYFPVQEIFLKLRKNILRKTNDLYSSEEIMKQYNDYLYRKDCLQTFTDGMQEWKALVKNAHRNGTLKVELADGKTEHYTHGRTLWKWG